MPGLLRLDVWLSGIGLAISALLLLSAPYAHGGSGCLVGLVLGTIGAVLLPTLLLAQFVSLRRIPQRQRTVVTWRALTPRLRALSIVVPLAGAGLVALAEGTSETDAFSDPGWRNHFVVAGVGTLAFSLFGFQALAILRIPAAEAARRCSADHAVPLASDFCPTCGAGLFDHGRLWRTLHREVAWLSHNRLASGFEALSIGGFVLTAVGLAIREIGLKSGLVAYWIVVGVLFGTTILLGLVVMGRRQQERTPWQNLKLLWRASPRWLWVLQAAVSVVFALVLYEVIPFRAGEPGNVDIPLLALFGFSGLYFHARGHRAVEEAKLIRRCTKGHLVEPQDVFCPDCGEALTVSRRT